jgi:hypothetical protein
MKRISFFCLCAAALWLPPAGAPAQDPASAAAIADREEAELRYKRINAQIEDLVAAQAVMQKKLAALSEELRQFKEDQARGEKFATRDDLRTLAEKLQEVERQRQEDRKAILDELQKLQKLPAPTRTTSKPAATPSPPAYSGKALEYIIQPNDTLSHILTDLRKQGIKVSERDIVAANPGLNPNRLLVGKKILIPLPKD